MISSPGTTVISKSHQTHAIGLDEPRVYGYMYIFRAVNYAFLLDHILFGKG